MGILVGGGGAVEDPIQLYDSGSVRRVYISGNVLSGLGGIWYGNQTPANGNYALLFSGTETYLNTVAGGGLHFREGNVEKLSYASNVWTFADAASIAFGTSTGVQLGTSAAQKIGFFGASPVVRQTLVAAVSTTGSGLASFGYSQAQADSIPVAINSIRTVLLNLGLAA